MRELAHRLCYLYLETEIRMDHVHLDEIYLADGVASDDVEVEYGRQLFLRTGGWTMVAGSPDSRRYGLLRQLCGHLVKSGEPLLPTL